MEQSLLDEQAAQPIVAENAVTAEEGEEPMNGDRNTFLKDKTLELHKEWEFDGHAAEWSPSSKRPLEWGDELRSWLVPGVDPDEQEDWSSSELMAISDDGRFTALATSKLIRIYTTADKEERAELVGHMANIASLEFGPRAVSDRPGARYTLFSHADDYENVDRPATIIVWHLDDRGRSLATPKHLPVGSLTDIVMGSIEQYLDEYGLSKDVVSRLRKDFQAVLSSADILNHQDHLTTFSGILPSFGSQYVSQDGQKILYEIEHDSTQSGMRSEDKLPQLVVRSLSEPDKSATLKGHTDAIMWASFSPTDPNVVASAAWDGTYRIWNVADEACTHTIRIKGEPQNWSGHFSPDGAHVLLSGTGNVAVYSVATGVQVSNLSDRAPLAAWVRSVSWSPTGRGIALASGGDVVLWDPLGDEDRVVKVVQWSKDEGKEPGAFREIEMVKWLDGDTLAAQTGEATWLVCDMAKQRKWRFQRPKGTYMAGHTGDAAMIRRGDGERVFVSLDADLRVREWLLD